MVGCSAYPVHVAVHCTCMCRCSTPRLHVLHHNSSTPYLHVLPGCLLECGLVLCVRVVDGLRVRLVGKQLQAVRRRLGAVGKQLGSRAAVTASNPLT